MLIIPAVDIMNGKSVRLIRGDPSNKKIYYNDPLVPATQFANEGAELLHVVDLDAALGTGENISSIERIVSTLHIPIEVGGGIRSLEKARQLLEIGVNRIIFGTSSVNNIEVVEAALKEFGPSRVAAAVDAKKDIVVVRGWTKATGLDYLTLARSLDRLGTGNIIFTSVDSDGTLTRPPFEMVRRLRKVVSARLIASGGVTNLDDIKQLAETRVDGTIIGTALYERRINLTDAFKVASKC